MLREFILKTEKEINIKAIRKEKSKMLVLLLFLSLSVIILLLSCVEVSSISDWIFAENLMVIRLNPMSASDISSVSFDSIASRRESLTAI